MPRSVPLAAYQTLGVSPQDEFATIRATWLTQVRALYVKAARGDEKATERLAELNNAYDEMRWHKVVPKATGPASAEAQRQELQRRRAEAERRARAQREAEARRAAAERAAEAQRKREAARQAEAARQREAERRAAQNRQAATIAEKFEDARVVLARSESRRTLCYA